jgi:hypothetical protein
MKPSLIQASLKSLLLSGVVGCGVILHSCDTVKPPTTTSTNTTRTMTSTRPTVPDTTNPPSGMAATMPDTNVSSSATRLIAKVLIEKYTGFRCGNCPAGTDVVTDLIQRNPTNVIAMSIHANSLAAPIGGAYSYDFRTLSGNALDNQFRATSIGTPSGMVNRTPFSNTLVLTRSAWGSAVAAQTTRTLDVAIRLTSVYLPTNRTVTARVEIEYLKSQDADNYLSLFVVEDSITQAQTDYRLSSTTIADYKHNHVLRGTMNTTWGTQLSTTAIAAGTTLTREISYVLPADWNERRASVIAFVHKYNTTWQVLQVEKVRIQKK